MSDPREMLMEFGRREYQFGRAQAAAQRSQTSRWWPASREQKPLTENAKAYYSLSESLVSKGYNPIQAIRHVFLNLLQRDLPPPEPKDILRIRVEPSKLQEEAERLASSHIGSSLAVIKRADIEAEFIIGEPQGPKCIDPALLSDNVDPVLNWRLLELANYEVTKSHKEAAYRSFLFCPRAYLSRCKDDLPLALRAFPTFERIISETRRKY